MTIRHIKLSKTSALHYGKLFFRSALLIAALIDYIYSRLNNLTERFPWVLSLIWIVFVVEMTLRFFPSKLESKGCQKQFVKNHTPTHSKIITEEHQWWRTAIVVFSWLLLNAGIAVLYFTGVIDRGIMILISLLYSVCDMICILFFCPFQSWMLKNKCCGSCRIYNWDYAMMFTPFVFIGGFYAWSLLGLSLGLLIRWEITYRRHTERFYPSTNVYLSCANCKEKLCTHKTQLRDLWRREATRLDKLKKKILEGKEGRTEDSTKVEK